ncbi:MAG: TraM recognition domain-containing protein [Francisellaceae bacterium]|jgi:intracellular multiplication protein IcmO|nr:TraM recognition domain-containing protein [Francisellaceae bacterium]MBT6208287.1 TraM recognition domain-containing protein [Francisellaceae bacterium]MBT6538279.1 TraM recognition domain-containing protein [Francisellaceae bacterium]
MSGIRGIDDKHEHAASNLARDTRPLGVRAGEFLSNPNTVMVFVLSSLAGFIIYPMANDLLFIVNALYMWYVLSRTYVLPMRLPMSSKAKDYNDLIPGTAIAKKAGGIALFGNDRRSREEVWFTNDDMRTHVLIFGSTGSGKTEALVSIAFNSLIHGSGLIYVDGKGDNSLFAKIFSMVRCMGRDDDMLLINFMTGARDVIGPQKNRLSNTMNPFSTGSSSMVSQLVVSLMDSGGGGGGGDMWKGRAINFVESLMKVLCAMRDAGYILIDANSIREYFILEKLEEMVVDKTFTTADGYQVQLEDYPPEILEPLKNYVLNLPGYNPGKKGDQAGEVREQHGFITMQLTRVFGSLADTYGHIIRTNLAEVDLKDVVLNRRVLVVLLPALEKSPEELSNLGKIIIASLKSMMAAGLGDSVEGDYRDVILRKPTNSPSPFVCIMDEYGYYAVPGFAVVPAQARSLGFSAIFAGQDLPAFQKASKEEAASIGANCNIKICMKLEDPQETWDFFNKVAGEAYVTNVSGFQMNSGSMTMNYMDTKNASVDRRQRIDLLDLKDQREGESHIFFKSKIVRAEMFYANPSPVSKMRLNHMLKVEAPPEQDLLDLNERLNKFGAIFEKSAAEIPQPPKNEDLTILAHTLQTMEDDLKPFERGIASLIGLLEHEVAKQRELSEPYENQNASGEISIFTSVPVNALVKQMIGEENVELFSLPLLRRGSTVEELKHIERMSEHSASDAEKNAFKVIDDIEKLTKYPPQSQFDYNSDKYFADVNKVVQILGGVPIAKEQVETLGKYDDIEQKHKHISEVSESLKEKGFDLDLPELPDLPDFDDMVNEVPPVPSVPEIDEAALEEKDKKDAAALKEQYEKTKEDELKQNEIIDIPTLTEIPQLPDNLLSELDAILKEVEMEAKKSED